MNRIAILHLMNDLEDSSISRIVRHLIALIGNNGIDWHVGGVSSNGSMSEVFRDLGARTVPLAGDCGVRRGQIRTLREYLQEHDIEIIHSHTPRTTIMARLASRGLSRTKHLATRHSLHKLRDRRWGLLYVLLDRLSLYLPDQIVAVSRSMQVRIAAQPFIPSKSVIAIQNAIDGPRYYAPDRRGPSRRELGFTSDELVLGYVGRIERGKRLPVLLRAFVPIVRHVPNARLLIVGEGTQRGMLSDLAVSHDIAHAVKWTGFRSDIADVLAAMDVYVQPSDNEGLSLSILEAMAAQKPVVAVDIPGVREVIEDGYTGLLAPRSSPPLLEAALTDLLQKPDKRARLGQNAQNEVYAKFALSSMTSAYENVYHALASR